MVSKSNPQRLLVLVMLGLLQLIDRLEVPREPDSSWDSASRWAS